jgi:hypothetical protein
MEGQVVVEKILDVGEQCCIVKTSFVTEGVKQLACYYNYGFIFLVVKFL